MTDEHELAREWAEQLAQAEKELGECVVVPFRRSLADRMAAELNRQKAEIERLQALLIQRQHELIVSRHKEIERSEKSANNDRNPDHRA